MESIVFVLISWLCASVFVLLGYACFKRRTPVNFWSGAEVKKTEVTNVRKYNVANGVMWCIYSMFYWIAGLAAIVSKTVSVIFLVMGCTVGIFGLILGYCWIKRRYFISYRDSYVASKLNDYK
ncbi:MAG: hypothetical protein IJF37_10195 [Lachnospiraceae bacterium]|nr:hypothetical protein [Lachnospiraceae bacterium]